MKMPVAGAIFDLDGVLWRGTVPLPGAPEALATLRDRGLRIGFCTNNSTRHRVEVAEALRRAGFEASPAEVLTSGTLAAEIVAMRCPGGPALVIGEDGLREELAEVGIRVVEQPSEARVVVVGWDRGISFDKLRRAHRAILQGAWFLATNPDRSFPEEDGGSAPGCGAITAALERSTGHTAECHGKPAPTLFARFAERWGLKPEQVVAVGDRLDTDVAAAKRFGCVAALALSGVTSPDEARSAQGAVAPDLIVESVATLPEALDLRWGN